MHRSPSRALSQWRHHVALIEDNDDARMSLRMLLEIEGHEVSEAADGVSGVDHWSRTPRASTSLFVDIGLPGMNGYATAQGIRAARAAVSASWPCQATAPTRTWSEASAPDSTPTSSSRRAIERLQQELALISRN